MQTGGSSEQVVRAEDVQLFDDRRAGEVLRQGRLELAELPDGRERVLVALEREQHDEGVLAGAGGRVLDAFGRVSLIAANIVRAACSASATHSSLTCARIIVAVMIVPPVDGTLDRTTRFEA